MSIPPLRVAIAGLGVMGNVALAAFGRSDGWQIVAVADLDPDKRASAAGQVPNVVTVDHAATLSDPSFLRRQGVDLLVVTTPPDSHADLSISALNAGVHVLCEKPLARNPDEADRMCATASASEGLAVVDFQLRFNRARRWLRDQLGRQAIGRVRAVEVRYALPSIFDAPWSWLSDVQSGGGLLNEFGSHIIDLLQWYFGDILEAQGVARTLRDLRPAEGTWRKADTDDIGLMTLTWKTGLVGTVAISSFFRPAARDLSVHGDTATLSLDQHDRITQFDPSGQLLRSLRLAELEPSLINRTGETFSQPFRRLTDQLGTSIREGTRPADIATFADGLRVVEVLDKVRYSSIQPLTRLECSS